ncbi:hypothetical protein BT69DRAFT_1292549 [Atractiella rhizophila]|nr:hypothetical protein BT69DRAFT_1292549 [Atractiella rhizophila]
MTRFLSKGEPLPRVACFKIQWDPIFLHQVSVKLPKCEKRKFTQKVYCSNKLNKIYCYHADLEEMLSIHLVFMLKAKLMKIQDPTDPFLTMARRASKGHFQDRKLFIGLIKVMLLKEDQEHSGRQLKGAMKYSAEFDQFCHLLVVSSAPCILDHQTEFRWTSRKKL